MIEKEVRVSLDGALMTRAAAKLAQRMNAFSARVLLRRGEMTVNGKSLMGIVSLAIHGGETITVMADGEDEEAAAAAFSEAMSGN